MDAFKSNAEVAIRSSCLSVDQVSEEIPVATKSELFCASSTQDLPLGTTSITAAELRSRIDSIAPGLGNWRGDSRLETGARLTQAFACGEIFVKRDDIGPLATGGSKARKIDRVLFYASMLGCNEIVSCGPATSNTCRALAGACAEAGLRATLFLHGSRPARLSGNAWMAEQMGATLVWAGNLSWDQLEDEASRYARQKSSRFLAPPGMSNVQGVLAIADAYAELLIQCDALRINPSAVVHANATGGMAAGLNLGAIVLGGPPVISINIVGDLLSDPVSKITQLVEEGLRLLQIERSPIIDPVIRDEYLEAGYGSDSPIASDIARHAARSAGLIVDPLYTAKALRAAIDVSRQTKDGESVIFWHTGGVQGFLNPELQT